MMAVGEGPPRTLDCGDVTFSFPGRVLLAPAAFSSFPGFLPHQVQSTTKPQDSPARRRLWLLCVLFVVLCYLVYTI